MTITSSYQILVNGFPDNELRDNLIGVDVSESLSSPTTCNARFVTDIDGGKFKFLDDDRLLPGGDNLLSIVAGVNNSFTVISHGLITDRRIDIVEGGPGSVLEIGTTDRRVEMDRACRGSGSRMGLVFTIVTQILAEHGFIPDVDVKYSAFYSEFTQALNQAGSDLALIQALAGQHDAYFWIDWTLAGPVVIETAHFKPSPAGTRGFSLPVSLPFLGGAPELRMNAGVGKATMTKFSSDWCSEVPNKSGNILRVDIDAGRLERGRVDGPTLDRLGDAPTVPSIECQIISPGDMAEAQRRQTAALNDAAWVVRASAESTVHALGGLVRPHETIKVSGVGAIDSGEYLVYAVHHQITLREHHMKVDLRRNAVGKTGFGLGIGGL